MFSFLNHRAKSITSAAFILLAAALAAKVLGLLRDRVLAGFFGAGEELDMYFAAFRIPDFLFNILILGAISTAFIPVFAEYWVKSKKEAWQVCNNIFCIFLSLLVLLSIALFIFVPYLMRLITPGFGGEEMAIVVNLTRIMLLSPILLGISNIFSSVLQYFSKFLIYSLAPIMYNLGIIFGAIFFVPQMGINGLAWGVVLGAFLHLLIQVPAVFVSGFRFKFILDFACKGTKKIIKLMIPRTIGLAANQINLIVITAIASTLAVGSISVFNFSNNLQFIPISLFGISFATAAFPSFSRSAAKRRKDEFLRKFTATFSQILFFVLPLSILFFLLRAQIVRIILGTGQFSWQDTRLTAACLGIFSLSIFAQSLVPLLARAFYAFKDTKTPVKISVLSIIFNIIFSVFFVWLISSPNSFYYFLQSFLKLEDITQISVIGLPLAFSAAAILNFMWLFLALKKKAGGNYLKFIPNRKFISGIEIGNSFLRCFLLSLVCGSIVFGILHLFDLVFDLHTFFEVFFQALLAGGFGIAFYIYAAKLLNFPEYKLIFSSFLSVKTNTGNDSEELESM